MAEHRAQPSSRSRNAVALLVALLTLGLIATGVVLVALSCSH